MSESQATTSGNAGAVNYVDPFKALGDARIPDDKSIRARGDYAAQIMGALITRVPADKDISLDITKQFAIHAVNGADVLLAQLAKTTEAGKRAGQ
jgi:hypothetical protein